ncbi:hypothetical protein [Paenibacillus cymbidii]|uniref:hypothetical protein n=1 Tax=Paenibacillus cymbidii TaxID=1639034 RepID=UPI00108095A1
MLTDLERFGPDVAALLAAETVLQSGTLLLIPSENYTSRAVRPALASSFTNKYAEGYPYFWEAGMKEAEMRQIGARIVRATRGAADDAVLEEIRREIGHMMQRFQPERFVRFVFKQTGGQLRPALRQTVAALL